jgi:hypothetical protein
MSTRIGLLNIRRLFIVQPVDIVKKVKAVTRILWEKGTADGLALSEH